MQKKVETIALVVNPRSTTGRAAAVWSRAARELHRRGTVRGEVETAADGANVERIRRMIGEVQPAVVVAAGGDGTVSDTARAIAEAPPGDPPALAILPLGTANNVARSLGLESLLRRGEPAVDLALGAIFGGSGRRIDLGAVGERYFVGSLAIGMDADILLTRNRLRHRLALDGTVGGYPLYLWSCAVNVLRRHGARARLRADGIERAPSSTTFWSRTRRSTPASSASTPPTPATTVASTSTSSTVAPTTCAAIRPPGSATCATRAASRWRPPRGSNASASWPSTSTSRSPPRSTVRSCPRRPPTASAPFPTPSRCACRAGQRQRRDRGGRTRSRPPHWS